MVILSQFFTSKPSSFLWLIIPFSLSPLAYAHAYIDPGAGSYAIQIAIGVIFGASYTLKSFGSKLLKRFKNRKNSDS